MRIKKAEYIKDYKIKLLFSDGITKMVDFKPFLSTTRKLCIPLLDLEYFKSFYLDEITICWPNELDFCPDDLYEKGIDVEKTKKKPVRQRKKITHSTQKKSQLDIAPKSKC